MRHTIGSECGEATGDCKKRKDYPPDSGKNVHFI
jgi:hypothetical protein